VACDSGKWMTCRTCGLIITARARAYATTPNATMSSTPSTSRSNLDSIFNAALQAYQKKTGKDIASHPLATELQSCHSPDTVLAVLRRQIPSLDQSQSGEERFAKCLTPIINVLCAFTATLGDSVGLVIVTMSPVENLCSNISLSDILSSKCNIYGHRASPLGQASLIPLCR